MKKLVLPKRIIGVFILVCIFLVPLFGVDAKKKCEEVLGNDAKKRYGLTFEPKDKKEKKFVIKMNPQTNDKKLQAKLNKIKFKVIRINSNTQNLPTGILGVGKNLSFNAMWENYSDEKIMEIELESTAAEVDGDFCNGKGVIRFTLTYIKGGDPIVSKVPLDVSDLEGDQGKIDVANPIVCGSGKPIDELFCRAKSEVLKKQPKAKNKKNSINFDGMFDGTYYSGKDKNNKTAYELKWGKFNLKEKETPTFKCDYKSTYSVDELKGENYYKPENKSYMYGSGSYEIPFKYSYHYAPDTDPETVQTSCKVKCEEAVIVEYGPPVASKAGLCFEYKVKVTSIVNCGLEKQPDPPKKDLEVCDPAPVCTTSTGFVSTQGGPNEEFDNCIKQCDGGKYTEKCSNKCYSQVYGKTELKMNNALQINAIEKMANKNKITKKKEIKSLDKLVQHKYDDFSMNKCLSIPANVGGCYSYNKETGMIGWQNAGVNSQGRWYANNPHKSFAEYQLDQFGFWRHLYLIRDEKGNVISSSLCSDDCRWIGCEDGQYINHGFAEQDYTNNKNIYKEAKKLCSAAASCSTTTATFTISVDYEHNVRNGKTVKKQKETINFPYSREEDKLNSNGSNTLKNKDTTLLENNVNGCYRDKKDQRWYQAEWSFPGTWIHNKTGEITYVPKTDKSWQKMQDKFCIPLDALNVNEKWWNYYYNKKLKAPNSTTESSYKIICDKYGNSITKTTSIKESDIEDWNIKAKTRKFGFFGWNINIECFYALNNNPANVPKTTTKSGEDVCIPNNPGSSGADTNYRIRPVDLTNLFPATDGSTLNSSSKTGRTPGFNWSQYATITQDRNNTYFSKPNNYISKIQSLGYKVYSKDNLDYEFNLSRDTLNNMKQEVRSSSSSKKYTDFKGSFETVNGVVHYKSSAIRNLAGNNLIPNGPVLNCNNMKSYYNQICEYDN